MIDNLSILFSFIIPVYNGEQYISRCLSSIYSQGVNESLFEVIIIDDGSNDGTERLSNEKSQEHRNLTVIRQENSGVSAARNRGLLESSGKFVIFMDIDDEIIPGSLSYIVSTLEVFDGDILIANQLNNSSGVISKRPVIGLENKKSYSGIEAFKLGFQRINAGGAICKKSFIINHKLKFPEGVSNSEDTIFFSLFQTYAQELRYEDIDFYIINLEKGSASRRSADRIIKGQETALRYMSDLRRALNGQFDMCIIEYTLYLLVSKLVNTEIMAKIKGYEYIKATIHDCGILPIKYSNCYGFSQKIKVALLNASPWMFYNLFAIKCLIIR